MYKIKYLTNFVTYNPIDIHFGVVFIVFMCYFYISLYNSLYIAFKMV